MPGDAQGCGTTELGLSACNACMEHAAEPIRPLIESESEMMVSANPLQGIQGIQGIRMMLSRCASNKTTPALRHGYQKSS
ncbi:uncharacterized protein PG998_001722 [Apiospora kogelbergensis]|uniref:Uncharacterized protein n=1 Tax=Apiospora kogelbergensis TaxID=1337665 RepID=A0AAW0QQK8_9PEZI